MVKLTGGGISGNKVVQDRKFKEEPKARAANVAGVAQMGRSVAFKKDELYAGRGYEPSKMGSTGIANARQGPAGAGPGGMGRTIYKSGSQSPTPPAREMPPGRDILSEYGRDVPGRGRR